MDVGFSQVSLSWAGILSSTPIPSPPIHPDNPSRPSYCPQNEAQSARIFTQDPPESLDPVQGEKRHQEVFKLPPGGRVVLVGGLHLQKPWLRVRSKPKDGGASACSPSKEDKDIHLPFISSFLQHALFECWWCLALPQPWGTIATQTDERD